MPNFATQLYVTGSARNFSDDYFYLQKISEIAHANHAMVFKYWFQPESTRGKFGIHDEEIDWTSNLRESTEALKHSDLVVIEATQSRFSQGFEAYLAAQYKKPTLIVTRAEIKDRFISGVANKYISIRQYKNEDDLEKIVSKFIKQNAIPEKDLRFNFILDRRIYKYLRDKSYETGKNKSAIIRELLENEIRRREQ